MSRAATRREPLRSWETIGVFPDGDERFLFDIRVELYETPNQETVITRVEFVDDGRGLYDRKKIFRGRSRWTQANAHAENEIRHWEHFIKKEFAVFLKLNSQTMQLTSNMKEN